MNLTKVTSQAAVKVDVTMLILLIWWSCQV